MYQSMADRSAVLHRVGTLSLTLTQHLQGCHRYFQSEERKGEKGYIKAFFKRIWKFPNQFYSQLNVENLVI